jgi:hypothetical protein
MDYYLKTISKEDFIQDLLSIEIEIVELENYFQNEVIIIDWIGQIPNPIEYTESGEPIGEITFKEGYHVNIRSVDEIDLSEFSHSESIFPNAPYRMFS